MASSRLLLSFPFSQSSDLQMFLIFRVVGEIRRVQIPHDICTRFSRYLYSTKLSWIIIGFNTLLFLGLGLIDNNGMGFWGGTFCY